MRSAKVAVLSRPNAMLATVRSVAPKLMPHHEFAEFPIHDDGLP